MQSSQGTHDAAWQGWGTDWDDPYEFSLADWRQEIGLASAVGSAPLDVPLVGLGMDVKEERNTEDQKVTKEKKVRRRKRINVEGSQNGDEASLEGNDNLPTPKGSKLSSSRSQASLSSDGSKGIGKNKLTSRNAEHCRKHREKRKREEQSIRTRNEELETERELFLSRIADLETEVASLRGGGQVDIEKENELLRVEIGKYKAFVQNIVQATMQAALVTPEEQYRLLRNFLDSGCAQSIGLAYTSHSDPSWSKAETLHVQGHNLLTWYQYLPRGTGIASAHRLNFRVDVLDFPVSREQLKDKIWRIFSTPDFTNKFFNRDHSQTVRRTVYETKLPEGVAKIREQQNQEDIKIMRFVTESSQNNAHKVPMGEFFLVTSYKETQIYPCAYEKYEEEGIIPKEDRAGRSEDSPDPAFVYLASSCATTLEKANLSDSLGPRKDDVVRIEAPLHIGCICRTRKGQPEKCDLTMVASYPVGDKGYKEIEGMSASGKPSINGNGQLSDKFKADLELNFNMILAQI